MDLSSRVTHYGPMGDADERPDARGYGEGWADLRRRTLRRDGYACRRCGADDRTLQAHHVVPRSAGGPDALENLLTLCRPCHGVIHQSNSSFDDVRDEAPLFPDRTAPEPVARMRTPDDQLCSRCGGERSDPTDLVAWTDPTVGEGSPDADHVTLCKPCAGLVLERVPACRRDELTANHRFSRHELSARCAEAPVRASVFAPPSVAVRREPRTVRERLVDDTVARFVINDPGIRWATMAVVGYVCLFLLLSL